MQLSKENDNPGLNRQSLARLVAQNFNRRVYTRRKIIEWKRLWMSFCTIPGIKAGTNKHTLS